MQANPTSIPGEFVAEGFFEDAETSYIPGTINVLYSTKGAVEDYTSDLTSDQIPDGWKNATTEVITNTSTEYKATITLSDEDQVELETHENVTLSELRSELLGEVQPMRARTMTASVSLQALEGEDWEAVLSFYEDLKKE